MCGLPVCPITFKSLWNHLDHLPLADLDSGCPGRVDLLLGVDIITEALLQSRRIGPPGSPVVFDTIFGWVLTGSASQSTPEPFVASRHALVSTGDDLL